MELGKEPLEVNLYIGYPRVKQKDLDEISAYFQSKKKGIIKEPLDVDFTTISKIWTVDEEKEFSELIKKQNDENK